MDLSTALLFFFSALGAFNGLLIGGYFLLFARPRSAARRLFGGFLLMLSVRVGKSVFLYFNRELAREYLQLGLTACLLIGPFLYFFTRALNRPEETAPPPPFWVHLSVWLGVATVGGMLYPYANYPELWNPKIVWGIYSVWFLYTLAAIRENLSRYRRYFRRRLATREDGVVVYATLSSLALVTVYATVRFTSYITGALAFSTLLYCSWVAVVFFRAKGESGEEADTVEEAAGAPTGGQRRTLLSPEQVLHLRQRLETVMADDRLFIDPNLKLADLAIAVGCTSHQLSDLLNNVIGRKFHHYLNDRRVALAQELIHTEDHLTLEAIGLSCGFNARSTFYKAFKKSTGTTPAQYKKDQTVNP